MTPATAQDCLRHLRIGSVMTQAGYRLAITRIEQLVRVERAIASHEMHEAHVREAAAASHQPLSTKETGE